MTGPLVSKRRGHGREDRDPLRRAGHRLPAGDVAALRRPGHHARLRLHRRGPAALGDYPTKAVVAPLNINPQIIMWDPATYPDVKAIKDLKPLGVEGPVLRRRRLHGLPDPERPAGQGPDRRLLRRHPGQLRGRRRQGRPAGLRLGRAVLLREGAEGLGQAHRLPADPRHRLDRLRAVPGRDARTTSTKYQDCFKKLVPIIQQSAGRLHQRPEPAPTRSSSTS